MKLSNKQKFVASLVVVCFVTIVGVRMYLGDLGQSACIKAGDYWDYDSNTCIPKEVRSCEERGGTWDWTNHECIGASDELQPCPEGYEKDVWGVCMPVAKETTTTTPPPATTQTPTEPPTSTEIPPEVGEFGRLLILVAACGGVLVLAVIYLVVRRRR